MAFTKEIEIASLAKPITMAKSEEEKEHSQSGSKGTLSEEHKSIAGEPPNLVLFQTAYGEQATRLLELQEKTEESSTRGQHVQKQQSISTENFEKKYLQLRDNYVNIRQLSK